MAAGLGFKTFATGEVLSAANVNGYLMQGVLVFASAAARDAAITAPAEGQYAFTKDTDSLFYYSGSAWVAATGISPTIVDAKGDLIAATAADAVSRLAVGANDTVLTADSTTATGLKWAAAAAGGMTELATGTLSGASVTLASISGTYRNLYLVLRNWQCAAGTAPYLTLNADTGSNYDAMTLAVFNNSSTGRPDSAQGWVTRIGMAGYGHPAGSNGNSFAMTIFDYTNTIAYKNIQASGAVKLTSGGVDYQGTWFGVGAWRNTAAITQLVINAQGTWAGGTYILYGVK